MHPMRRPCVLRLCCALMLGSAVWAASVASSAQAPQSGAIFHTETAIVSLNVTVRDQANRPVGDLNPQDFIVLEDGRPQKIAMISAERIPLSLSFLLDSSASMDRQLALAKAAVIGFVDHLEPRDFASIIDFDSQVRILQPFTNDQALLERAVAHASASGGTALFNALYVALRDLARLHTSTTADIRRQAIVVVSDGEDTQSIVGFDDVLDAAKRSQTVIYTIGLGADGGGKRRRAPPNGFVLRRLAVETGGEAFFPESADELAPIYQKVARELATQYLVAYAPTNVARDGRWRSVAVRVNRANCVARTRTGYYAPTAAASAPTLR
jgi:Ca-activated chloride channel family protein